MRKYIQSFCLILLMAMIAGCGTSEEPENPDGESPAVTNPEPSDEPQAESDLLKQEMIDLVAELMQTQNPDADSKELLSQADQMLSKEIDQVRKLSPDFLILSAENKKKLRDGTPLEDSAKRIAEGISFLREYEIELSSLVQLLITQHEAGQLTPVRTELLAQLLTADVKKVTDALGGDDAGEEISAFVIDMDAARHELPQAELDFLFDLIAREPDVDTPDHINLDPPYRVIVESLDLALEPDELILMHKNGTKRWKSAGVRNRILASVGISN